MRHIPIVLLAVSAVFVSFSVLADVPAYALVKDKSFLKFFAIQNGAPVEGGFKDFTADIRFDPDHLDQGSITVEVATGSVTTANDEITQNLKLPDWLSVAAFPKAVFKCTKLNRMPQSNNYYADGTLASSKCFLTLRDKTMPVVLNFQMEHFDDKTAIAKGYVTLSRSDFGVGQGEWAKNDVIENAVRIEFRVTAEKK